MKTIKTSTSSSLRDEADAAIAVWRAAATAAATLREQFTTMSQAAQKARTAGVAPKRLELYALEIRTLEAEDVATTASTIATALLGAAEVAEGDPLAVAADAGRLHAGLTRALGEEQRLRDELAIATQNTYAQIGAAHKAEEELATRRKASELPLPARLPLPMGHLGGVPISQLLLGELARGNAGPVKKSNAARIRQIRQEDTELRAHLELERIEREQRIADAARDRATDQRTEDRRARSRREEEEKQRAESQAQRDRVDQLAAAHRARTAG